MRRAAPAQQQAGASGTPTEVEAALFSTLDVLGFDSAGTAAKCGVNWEPTLFRTSQTKPADAVLHFLFSKWDSNRTMREFAGLWPVYDARQSREFRRTVLSLLSELEASGAVPAVPNLQAILAASSGPRFVELLWRFALLCLKLAWQRECQPQAGARKGAAAETSQVCPPAALPASGAAVTQERVDVAEACLSIELSRFLDETAAIAAEQESWRAAAGRLTEEFRALQTQKAVAERTLSQLQRSQHGQADVSAELEIEEALGLWKARKDPCSEVDRTARLLAERSGEVSTAMADYASHPHTIDGAALRASPLERDVDLARLANDWARSMQLAGQAFVGTGTADDRRRQSEGLAAEAAGARAEAERRVATLRALVDKLRAEVAVCKGAIANLQARVDERGEESAGNDPLLLRTPGRAAGAGNAAGGGGGGGGGSRGRVALPLLAPVTPMVVTEGARGA